MSSLRTSTSTLNIEKYGPHLSGDRERVDRDVLLLLPRPAPPRPAPPRRLAAARAGLLPDPQLVRQRLHLTANSFG